MTHYTCGNIFTAQTWSIPDNTRIVGDEQQTVIKAVDSSMTVPFSGSYIIEMGGSNANGNLCPTSGSCISGDLLGNAGPSLDDEAFYFLDISSWAQANKGKDFYFESFDEARKAKVRRSTAGTDQSAFLVWCVERKIELIYIQPGERKQNARVESFHGRLGEERLTVSWFQNLFDVRRKIAALRKEYNVERPHISLEYRTPQDFAAATRASEAGPALMAPPS